MPYKFTQESGEGFRVITPDKSDALEDTNEVRQILDDLGDLLGHSKRDDLYPKDGSSGGKITKVTFPAIQVPSADANTLDDYKEETWTPAYTSTGAEFTYTNQNGTYVKIGKIVFITFTITTTAVGGTTSNAVTITGLPFVPANETGISFAVSNIAYIPMGAIVTDNVIYLRRQNTLTQLVAADLAGDGQFLVGSGFYSI